MTNRIYSKCLVYFFGILAGFFVVACSLWTIVPYCQMKTYTGYMTAGKTDQVLQSKFIFSPYTYAQKSIRVDLLTYAVAHAKSPSALPLLQLALTKMEELIGHEGYNPYYYIFLARGYSQEALLSQNPQLLGTAELYFKKAINLSPRHQEMYYAYGTFLLDHQREAEGRDVLGQALALSDQASLSHYYYARGLLTLGPSDFGDVLDHMEFFFNNIGDVDIPDPLWVQGVYERLLHYFYDKTDKTRVLVVANRLAQLDIVQREAYQQIVDIINKTGKLPVIKFN